MDGRPPLIGFRGECIATLYAKETGSLRFHSINIKNCGQKKARAPIGVAGLNPQLN